MNFCGDSVNDCTPLFQSGGGGSSPTSPHQLIKQIKSLLSPAMLKREYRDKNKDNPMFGHCYVATEALFYCLGDSNFKPMRGRDSNGIVHWWLMNTLSGEILDATSEQYTSVGLNPPYESGRGGGFLTKFPSKRCLMVIQKTQDNPARYKPKC